MNRIPVIVWGAGGRMGGRVIRMIVESEDLRLAGAVEKTGHESLGTDAGRYHGGEPAGVRIREVPDVPAASGIVVVFALPDGPAAAAQWAAEHGWGIVCGTTAMSGKDHDRLNEASRAVPVVAAPNFSIGIQLLLRCVSEAARILPEYFHAGVFETHHRAKLDAPSGTARAFEDALRKGRQRTVEPTAAHRLSKVVGEHSIRFVSPFEDLRFEHRAMDRDVFAAGALVAARWLHGKDAGMFCMQDLIGTSG